MPNAAYMLVAELVTEFLGEMDDSLARGRIEEARGRIKFLRSRLQKLTERGDRIHYLQTLALELKTKRTSE